MKQDIIEVRNHKRGNIVALFKKRETANNIVGHPSLKDHNLRAFIPVFCVTRTEIIKNIPLDISEILKEFESLFKIVSTRRFGRKVRSLYFTSFTVLFLFKV